MIHERKRLKNFLKSIKHKCVGPRSKKGCCKVQTSKKKKRVKFRNKRLYAHQVSFFLKNGYLPPLVSHCCHVHNCFVDEHLLDEDDFTNKSRERCKNLLIELKKKLKAKQNKKKKRKTLFVADCPHEPKCFLKVGQH